MHAREQELGAVFYEAAGWERPQWYEVERAARRASTASESREAEWDARWWSPIINAEHLAMREHARASSTCPRSRSSTSTAPARSRRCSAASLRADGRRRRAASSTRRCCRPSGGFSSDLTIMRLGDEQFRVVTGGAHGMADKKWFADHLPEDGSATLVDVTTGVDDDRPLGAARARHPRVA